MVTNQHPLKETIGIDDNVKRMIHLYMVVMTPRPPPPAVALDIQGRINMKVSLVRGLLEKFMLFMLDVYDLLPKTDIKLLRKEQIELAKKNPIQVVDHLNDLFNLNVEVKMQGRVDT